MQVLNLGIVAHVDAGKTSLTERLLYAAGVIDAVGSVDQGSTQTDTLSLERERGITIKSAVVSFKLGDLTVNLIDTPGHPDFIAEVDRVLNLLDGVILVISAVEGVQAQTRVLMRALRRLGIPTLIFVNKIDRMGADVDRVMAAIKQNLTPTALALGRASTAGTRDAGFIAFDRSNPSFIDALTLAVAEHDDELLRLYVVEEKPVEFDDLTERFTEHSQQALIYPVVFGSAITGAGIDELADGIATLLPSPASDENGPPSGLVFKIDRSSEGERTALVRMFAGTLRTRDRVQVGGDLTRVTKIAVFENGGTVVRDQVTGGQIAKVSGLGAIRIGDAIGEVPNRVRAGTGHDKATPMERSTRTCRARPRTSGSSLPWC